MRLSSKALIVVITIGSLTFSCRKDKGGDGGGGGDTPAPAEEAGTIQIDSGDKDEDVGDDKKSATKKTPPEIVDDAPQLAENKRSMNQQIPLRPAQLVGTLAVALTEQTEFDKFEEGKFVWNPAQIPLEELNKIVCVLSKSGFHWHSDKDTYTAKITLDDCFVSADQAMLEEEESMGASKVRLPSDVTVSAARSDEGVVTLKVWFTRKIENTSSSGTRGSEIFIWQNYDLLELDYYVQATITEVPTNENPFGQFDMRWEMLLRIDGELDENPYQEGYVTTGKTENESTLKYNQVNFDYHSVDCPATASITYNGFDFFASANGSSFNGTELNFNGTDTISTVTAASGATIASYLDDDTVFPAGSATFAGGADETYPTVTIDGILFQAGALLNHGVTVGAGDTVSDLIGNHGYLSLTVPGGTDMGQALTTGTYFLNGGLLAANSTADYRGLPLTMNMQGAFANGLEITFDGTSTLLEVLNQFELDTGYTANYTSDASGVILPAMTLELNGGYDVSPATATVETDAGTVTLRTNDQDGRALDGFRFYFDGNQSVDDVLNNAKYPVMGIPVWADSGNSWGVPAEGFVVLTGGAGPPQDVFRNDRIFAASAKMSLVDGQPMKGQAHTAENWNTNRVTDNCPGETFSADPTPISYGMAFDRNDKGEKTNANPFPGRAALKQFNDFVSSDALEGFDASALRCDQMGGELADVWNYALFTPDGKELKYRTDFPLYLENSNNEWGDGWVSPWGISIWDSAVTSGDKAYIKNADGTKRVFDIVRYNGALRSYDGSPAMDAETSGTKSFTCDSFCPVGELTQAMLDNTYDSTAFLYDQEYVFDYATKKLYRDLDKDGGMDAEVKFASNAQGWFNFTLTDKDDIDSMLDYYMDSYNAEIGLKEGNALFTAPKRIVFDSSQIYTAADAYPGSSVFNSSHEGSAFADLINGGGTGEASELTFEYGTLCCFDYEEKVGLLNEWGNNIYASKVALKKGVELTVKGDPDGTGPIKDGMKIKLAPAYTELRPIAKDDCSADLEDTVTDIENGMPLPEPLAKPEDRKISAKIGDEPEGPHPVFVINGENVAE